MMQIIGCKQCGKETIEFGQETVNVVYSAHKWCDKCGSTKKREENDFFCSYNCFMNYMRNVIREDNDLV